jgi:hypothetical protein
VGVAGLSACDLYNYTRDRKPHVPVIK